MRHLDRNRPFAEVFGLPPAVYQQDGHYFLRNGHPWVDPAESAPVDAEVVAAIAPEEKPPERVGKVAADDMRLAANRQLKVHMESYGQEWQGVEHAKKFLGLK